MSGTTVENNLDPAGLDSTYDPVFTFTSDANADDAITGLTANFLVTRSTDEATSPTINVSLYEFDSTASNDEGAYIGQLGIFKPSEFMENIAAPLFNIQRYTLSPNTQYTIAFGEIPPSDETTTVSQIGLASDETGLTGQYYDGSAWQNGDNFPGVSITENSAACYCSGTLILTNLGQVAVEDLRIGDLVVTFAGQGAVLKPVRWMGHRRLDLRRHPDPENTHPVRFRTGSMGDGVPHRDLLVSPNHRMHIDGTLVTAIELVNGASIVQESPDQVEYWHIELDGHDLVLAAGVQAETYVDTGNRSAFENADVTALNPVLDGDVPQPCLPYAGVSAATRERLIARAEALGWTRSIDPMPWLEVDGQRIEATRHGETCRFTLPAGSTTARLRSHATRPWDVDPHSGDRRQLGLKLHHLAVGNRRVMRKIALDAPYLTEGFNHVESDGTGWTWRWTNGDALLPLKKLVPGRSATVIEIAYDQALPMWGEPAVIAGVAEGSDGVAKRRTTS